MERELMGPKYGYTPLESGRDFIWTVPILSASM